MLSTIMFRAKWTLWLAVPTIILSGILGGISGLYCGRNSGGKADSILSTLALLINTIPTNCLAIVFLVVLAFQLGLFPSAELLGRPFRLEENHGYFPPYAASADHYGAVPDRPPIIC